MARAVIGDDRVKSERRTPRRVLGVYSDDTHPSNVISRDSNYQHPGPDSGDSDDPTASQGVLWFNRFVRQERDGGQDELGEVISDWIPSGEVTAISMKVMSVSTERGDKWANMRTWHAEFPPDCVKSKDMLVNSEGEQFTVQTVAPVIDGGKITRENVILSERVDD